VSILLAVIHIQQLIFLPFAPNLSLPQSPIKLAKIMAQHTNSDAMVMDLFSDDTPVQPTRRGVEDEDADFKAIVNNLTTAAYKEWPNEAGVSSLSQPDPAFLNSSRSDMVPVRRPH
jgi:hypothetical protein